MSLKNKKTLTFLMTTTFYPPYHIGGDAIHVYYLANELAKLGHKIHIIHLIDSYRWQRKEEPTGSYPNHPNITVHSIKSPIGKVSPLMSYIFGTYYPISKEILRLIYEINPDVIHHHNIAGFGPFILNIEAPVVLYTAHDYWALCPMNSFLKYKKYSCNGRRDCFLCSLYYKRPPQLWRYIKKGKYRFSKIDTIIAPSRYMAEKLSKEIEANIITIPNFVPTPPQILPNSKYENYFLYIGLLENHKGILNLIELFKDCKDEINSKLLIVGEGTLKNKIKTIIRNYKLEDRILLLGWKEHNEIYSLLKNAYALIVPSIWPENSPLVSLEALSVGTPVIGTNMGGIPEIVEKVNPKFILKDFNKKSFLDILPLLSEVSRDSIIKTYKEYFSIESYLNEYLPLVEVLL
jgi:glycosyltransferase involved in cell wall biosynthesis